MCDTNKGSPHSPLHVMKCMVLNSVMYYLSQICYLLFAIEKCIGTSWVFFRRPVVFCIFYGQAETKQEVNWKVKVLNSIIMNLLNQSKQRTHTQISLKFPAKYRRQVKPTRVFTKKLITFANTLTFTPFISSENACRIPKRHAKVHMSSTGTLYRAADGAYVHVWCRVYCSTCQNQSGTNFSLSSALPPLAVVRALMLVLLKSLQTKAIKIVFWK